MPSAAPARPARRHFDAAYKLRIARMICEDAVSLSQVCRDQQLTPCAVHRWMVQSDCDLLKSVGLVRPRAALIQQLMQSDKASITQLSRVFDLSRSALRQARTREPAAPLPYSSQAMQLFDASGSAYGSRRLSHVLKMPRAARWAASVRAA